MFCLSIFVVAIFLQQCAFLKLVDRESPSEGHSVDVLATDKIVIVLLALPSITSTSADTWT